MATFVCDSAQTAMSKATMVASGSNRALKNDLFLAVHQQAKDGPKDCKARSYTGRATATLRCALRQPEPL